MKEREKALFRVLWGLYCYCLILNLFAANYAAAQEATQSKSIPSAIVEDLGEGYASWKYLHVAFLIPVRQIFEKARTNFDVASNVTTSFEYHRDHLHIRLDVLNSTLVAVDVGKNGYRF